MKAKMKKQPLDSMKKGGKKMDFKMKMKMKAKPVMKKGGKKC